MHHQRIVLILEGQPEELSAPMRPGNAVPGEPRNKVRRTRKVTPNRTWMCDVNRLEGATDDMVLEPTPHHLNLGQLRHMAKRSHTTLDTAIHLVCATSAGPPCTNSAVAGVGNSYAAEALWRAKIHGERIAAELSRPDLRRLLTEVHAVMSEALRAGGTFFDAPYDKRERPIRLFLERPWLPTAARTSPAAGCGAPIRRESS
jgi:formamidopyrimidine-DNA glycosylase